MIAVIDVGVGDHVIVALGVVADLIVVVVIVVDVVDNCDRDRCEGLDEGKEWKDVKSVMFTLVVVVPITIPFCSPGMFLDYNFEGLLLYIFT